MRRLTLLLAASVLGSGCVASSGNTTTSCRTVSVGWPTFTLADGTVTSDCSVAGVPTVDVYMNDQPVGRFPCTQGGVSITDVPSGTNLFTVEGVVASGSATTIYLRDEIQVTSAACGEQIVDTHPGEGTLALDYHFTPTDVCTAGGSYMWFSVYDQILKDVTAVADETANTTAYACGSAISFPMPVGSYTLQRIEEVTSSGYAPAAANCNAANFNVDPGTASVVTVDLADTNQLCPASTGTTTVLEAKRLRAAPTPTSSPTVAAPTQTK